MAHRKAGGSAKNLRDSNPKYLGIKVNDGQKVIDGAIIVRQRGTDFLPGNNVYLSKDHTIHAKVDGVVKFGTKRKVGFNNKIKIKKVVNVI